MSKNAPELKLKIKVNGKEIQNTLTTFKREYWKAKRQLESNPMGSELWKDAAKNLIAYKKLVDEAERDQKEFIDQMKSDEQVIDDFTGSIATLFSGFKTGNYQEIQAGFNGIAGSIKGVGKAAIALLASPIGIAITLLTGISLATKEWANYNKAVVKSARIAENVTGLIGDQMHATRLHAESIADIFDQDYKKTLEVGNVLVKKFGISWLEALETIED